MEYNGFKLVGDGTFGYTYIKPLGKGSVPLSLRDTYTTKNFAKSAIDGYLASNKKGKTNDKADTNK